MDSATMMTELVFGCKDLRNHIFDFLRDKCPICEGKMPLGWSASRFPKYHSKWKNSKLPKKIDSNLVAIYNGFCSSSCCDKFRKVYKLVGFRNPTFLIDIDKKLVANIKKLTPCEECHIPLTPRQVRDDIKNGGSLKGCGTDYGLSYEELPWIVQKYIKEPKTVFVCDSCYDSIDDKCNRRACSKIPDEYYY